MWNLLCMWDQASQDRRISIIGWSMLKCDHADASGGTVMKEERLKQQLQQILQAEVRRESRTVKEWKAMGGSRTSGDWYTSVKVDNTLYVPTALEGSTISLLAITADDWTPR